MRRPLWAPHLQTWPAPGEGVFVMAEGRHRFLGDPALALLAPLLDGTRTDEEIIDLLEGQVSSAHLYYRLQELRRMELVWDTIPFARVSNSPGVGPWAASVGLREEAARRSWRRTSVSVRALGGLDSTPLRARLDELGMAEGGDLTIVLTDDYLRREMGEVEAPLCLPVKASGQQIWVGPLLGGTGPCWECVAERLRLNRRGQAYLARQQGTDEPFLEGRAWLPSTRALGLELAASEVARLVAGKGRAERLWIFDLETRESTLHAVVKRPHCPRCGTTPDWQPPVLQPSLRPPGLSHGADPDELFARLEHHISPVTGVIARLTVPPADELVQVVQTWQNLNIRALSVGALRNVVNMMGMGKGRTFAQARISAVGEALERYCGVYQGYETSRTASFQELGTQAIHPNALMLYSERQYAERARHNAGGDPTAFVPEVFDESAPVAWTTVWSLTHGEPRYVPSAQAWFQGDDLPQDAALNACSPDSNGCAAGHTLEEALLQGLYELLERDSIGCWYYPMSRHPSVDLEELGMGAVLQHYARQGRDLWVLDITSDLGIPAYAAISRRREGTERILMGFGCHVDPARAVRGAVGELNQLLVFYRANSQAAQAIMLSANRWFEGATVENQPYLAPSEKVPLRAPLFASCDALEELRFLQHRLEQAGLELLMLDQSRPDIELRVARAMVPGLRHFWPRFAPGRMPGLEEDMNPLPIFL